MNVRTWTGLALGLIAGLTLGGGSRVLLGSSAAGMQAGGGRVAVIDVVKAFNEYQRQKDLEAELQELKQKLQAEQEQRRGRIEAMQATLDAMDQDDPTYAEKMRELLAEQIELKNWMDLAQADMQREIGVWTARVYQEIIDASRKVAAARGYDVVLAHEPFRPAGIDPEAVRQQIRLRTVVYATDGVDITDAVLEELNKTYRAQPKTKMLKVLSF